MRHPPLPCPVRWLTRAMDLGRPVEPWDPELTRWQVRTRKAGLVRGKGLLTVGVHEGTALQVVEHVQGCAEDFAGYPSLLVADAAGELHVVDVGACWVPVALDGQQSTLARTRRKPGSCASTDPTRMLWWPEGTPTPGPVTLDELEQLLLPTPTPEATP